MKRIVTALGICCFSFLSAHAQNATALQADFGQEKDHLKKDCSAIKSAFSCASDFFTEHPLHIAAGSLAPQNGFAAGLALENHWTPNRKMRLLWDADAVASPNGSWRAAGFMTLVLDVHQKIKTREDEKASNVVHLRKSKVRVGEEPV